MTACRALLADGSPSASHLRPVSAMVVTVLSCEAGGRPGRWPPSRTTQSARHAASAAVGLSGLLLELVFQFCRITDWVGPLLQLAGELAG